MGNLLTIGELAKAGNVAVSTIRYYERQGLLKPNRRSASNYRLYSGEDAQRLRFIRAAQATGFALDDVKELLRPAPCRRVQELIDHRLEVVEARMLELRHVRGVLRRSLDECREHEPAGRCRVVDDLSAKARRSRG